MFAFGLLLAATVGYQDAGASTPWVPFTSREGSFVIDFPGKPTKNTTRNSRSKSGQVKIIVVECETPGVKYLAEKIEIPPVGNPKPADLDAILDYWRDDVANTLNGKVVAQKNLRLETGAHGRDFTIEARPEAKGGLSTIRVREFLSSKVLYLIAAVAAPDRELPDDVGHYFASFSPGTNRTKKVGPQPEPEGKTLGNWGLAIDPDGDCKIDDKGKALRISIPGTHHDLNADNNKLNAPRVVREITGDFGMTVKVTGTFNPGSKSTIPYIGGGIVVWQDSDNYIFLGWAATNRNGKINEFAAFEEREWGTRGALNNRGIEPGGVFLRLERRNHRILGGTSLDGKNWSMLDPMEPGYPATLKVGLYAINGTPEPITIEFGNFVLTEGKAPAKARSKR